MINNSFQSIDFEVKGKHGDSHIFSGETLPHEKRGRQYDFLSVMDGALPFVFLKGTNI